jgi:hypothetical protein
MKDFIKRGLFILIVSMVSIILTIGVNYYYPDSLPSRQPKPRIVCQDKFAVWLQHKMDDAYIDDYISSEEYQGLSQGLLKSIECDYLMNYYFDVLQKQSKIDFTWPSDWERVAEY